MDIPISWLLSICSSVRVRAMMECRMEMVTSSQVLAAEMSLK